MRENVVVFNIETTGVAWYEEFLQFAACDYASIARRQTDSPACATNGIPPAVT